MNTTNVKLYSLRLADVRTYLFAVIFIAGNILLPQLCHTVHLGGPRWLPIYFFTIIAAYKYGWRVGLLTAVLSPIANSLLFGMPAAAMLPVIVLKSSLAVAAASYAAHRFDRVTLALMVGVVLFYQIVGSLGEWAISRSLTAALQDFRIGIPGMVVQVVGCWVLLRYILRR